MLSSGLILVRQRVCLYVIHLHEYDTLLNVLIILRGEKTDSSFLKCPHNVGLSQGEVRIWVLNPVSHVGGKGQTS